MQFQMEFTETGEIRPQITEQQAHQLITSRCFDNPEEPIKRAKIANRFFDPLYVFPMYKQKEKHGDGVFANTIWHIGRDEPYYSKERRLSLCSGGIYYHPQRDYYVITHGIAWYEKGDEGQEEDWRYSSRGLTQKEIDSKEWREYWQHCEFLCAIERAKKGQGEEKVCYLVTGPLPKTTRDTLKYWALPEEERERQTQEYI